jgi:anaerobic magnesium-protoporphyrin IX monomethyl ester cyclase
MRVTMIYVGIGVAGMSADRPLGDREGSWIAHGVSLVAACAKAAGHAVDLIDMRQLAGWDGLIERIKRNPADVYGLSVSPVDYATALKAILTIKRTLPKTKIIVGGITPTIFPDEFNFPAIDCIICGEGEVSFVEVLAKMQAGEPVERVVIGKKPDLDAIPYIDRYMWEYDRELCCTFAPDQRTPSITMLAGRGCPYHCTYCQPAENSVFGKPFRIRSVENVIGEMKALHDRHKYKSVTFWDDTFTFKKSWVMDFCDAYEKSGIKASIAACSRADIICRNEDMIKRLSEIGLDWFVIGLESGSQRILDLIKKGTTVSQNVQAANICRKYGIKIFGTYMYGLPTETEADTLATAKMIDEISPEHPSPFWFTPIRGTDIYTYCADNDLILPEVERRTIERTGKFQPTLRNINYDYISEVMSGRRTLPQEVTA